MIIDSLGLIISQLKEESLWFMFVQFKQQKDAHSFLILYQRIDVKATMAASCADYKENTGEEKKEPLNVTGERISNNGISTDSVNMIKTTSSLK